MTVSTRAFISDEANQLTAARNELAKRGVTVTDLTDTNPTNHGLFDEDLLQVVAGATRHAAHYQPHPRGPLPAREALAAKYGGSPDSYWLTASTSEAYSWLFTLLADPGDRVALPTPGYPLIGPLARLAGLNTVDYQTIYLHPHGWEYDLDSMAVAAAQSKAVTVINPNNPTGGYVDAAVADALIDVLNRTDTPLIADEVFFPFSIAPTPGATRLAGSDSVVTFGLDGLSKLIAAPQLKLGWIRLSGPTEATAAYARALDAISDSYLAVGAPIALALPELLQRSDVVSATVRERIRANHAIAQQVFGNDGYRVRRAAGGWMVLIDTPPVPPGTELALEVLQKAHLAVHPGWFYDLDSANTLALSLLPMPTVFEANCRDLKAALN